MAENRFAQGAFAPEAADETPSSPNPPAPGEDALDFDPVALRARSDGWTPARQREFVEALADTGIIRAACARVGMTESSLNRLRRRADARTFDRACDRAMRIGARRIVSIAYERAIEGTVRRHYFHGELKAEERVYDNRLLIALLGKLPNPHARDSYAEEIADSWEPWMDAVEQGLPEPSRYAHCFPDEDTGPFEASVWEEKELNGEWVTDAPPPFGFEGFEDGEFGERFYCRTLTEGEEKWWLAEGRDLADAEPSIAGGISYRLGRETFCPMGHALSATSEPSEPGEPE